MPASATISSKTVSDFLKSKEEFDSNKLPSIVFERRKWLKASLNVRYSLAGKLRHALQLFCQDVASVVLCAWKSPVQSLAWLGYLLWGYHQNYNSEPSGRTYKK